MYCVQEAGYVKSLKRLVFPNIKNSIVNNSKKTIIQSELAENKCRVYGIVFLNTLFAFLFFLSESVSDQIINGEEERDVTNNCYYNDRRTLQNNYSNPIRRAGQ